MGEALMYDDLVTVLPPPPKRLGKTDGEHEHHLYEGAVMLAYAMHLLNTEPTKEVRVHPDGQNLKQFDFSGWLEGQGFRRVSSTGKTSAGGTYSDAEGRTIIVYPKSGLTDVVAKVGSVIVSAECKGGIINTRHGGQVSQLRKRLCEAVGQLLAKPLHGRQVAVVPYTKLTFDLATQLAPRCADAGIELALVKSRGEVIDVPAP